MDLQDSCMKHSEIFIGPHQILKGYGILVSYAMKVTLSAREWWIDVYQINAIFHSISCQRFDAVKVIRVK